MAKKTKIDATPAAAELAEELGVDVSEIEGTGKDGRVLVSDVEAAAPPEPEEGEGGAVDLVALVNVPGTMAPDAGEARIPRGERFTASPSEAERLRSIGYAE